MLSWAAVVASGLVVVDGQRFPLFLAAVQRVGGARELQLGRPANSSRRGMKRSRVRERGLAAHGWVS